MSRTRRFILLFAPLPILAVSVGLSNWMTHQQSYPPAENLVLGTPQWASVAGGGPFDRTVVHKPVVDAAPGQTSLEALCADSARRLQARLGPDAAVVVHPPFVLAGDMSASDLDGWYQNTLAPAVEAMDNTYFDTPPSQPITVLLYPGETSYNAHALELFGDQGISVYGYYKPRSRTLVMNIGTGAGTLVHELTHALLDFDFPNVPAWFNEGLASLHEHCQFRHGPDGPWVEGLVNWRLGGLQAAIRAGRLRTLKSLIEADDFRGELEGANYAQARYLCLYLQQQNLLGTFYQRFRAAHPSDPRGIATLEEVLEIQSWSTLDRDFQTWVMALTPDAQPSQSR